MRSPLLALVAVLGLLATAPAQTASYTGSSSEFHALNVPKPGAVFSLMVQPVPPTAGGIAMSRFLFFGASKQSFAGLPLPLPLQGLSYCRRMDPVYQCVDSIGFNGSLLQSADILLPMMPSYSASKIRVDIPIPNDPGLLGVEFFNQILTFSSGRFGYRAFQSFDFGMTLGHGVIGN